MSRLEGIKEQIRAILLTIDGTDQGTYTYTSNTGTVDIMDEALSLVRNHYAPNDSYDSVNHMVDEDDTSGISALDVEFGQDAISNSVVFKITSRCHNTSPTTSTTSTVNPRIEIDEVMNGVIDDLLYAFYKDWESRCLNGLAVSIVFVGAHKEYVDITNNRIQSGNLITRWEVKYSQSISNPAIPACSL